MRSGERVAACGGITRKKHTQCLSTAQRLNSERRERHMEAVLKNLASTAELLAVAAQCDVVEQWDKQTLTRAFDWARYCEHLFYRFHNNQAVRGIMEKQLQLTNHCLRATFPGYTDVSFSDLSRCQHQLLVGLMNNPKLPSSIMKILYNNSPVGSEDSDYEDVTGLCSQIIQCKSACKVLGPMTESSCVGADAEVQGVMLMERLGSEACRTEHFLDYVLQPREGREEHFCQVIAAALLTKKNSAAESASQAFLLDWLRKKHSVLNHMCATLPAILLMDLVKQHWKFRDAYCDVLKKWTSDMEYSISDGEWVHVSTKPTVSFQKLTEHFLLLFETCPSMREDVEKELTALKISDGDFDVRGLSVWGDLLSALNK